MAAYLEITCKIASSLRPAAARVYNKYREAFLNDISGAQSKQLLVRDEDVQVLHGFDSVENAQAYLQSTLFTRDVVGELGPLLEEPPEIRIYDVAG